MWPTPAARDHKGANSEEHLGKSSGSLHLDQLPNFVEHVWSTPRSSDGEKGGPNQSFGAGGVPLAAQAQQWSTPSVADTMGSRKSRSGDRSDEPLLNGQAEAVTQWATPRSEMARAQGNPKHITAQRGNGNIEDQTAALSLPDRPISTVGEASSHIRRTLNPLFVEWLMGWPPGWTSLGLTPPASSVSACSETGLSRFKQRMRSALSHLASPPEAPAQLGLFG